VARVLSEGVFEQWRIFGEVVFARGKWRTFRGRFVQSAAIGVSSVAIGNQHPNGVGGEPLEGSCASQIGREIRALLQSALSAV
jgi:hypothetical protein